VSAGKAKKKSSGRRRNYGPTADAVGYRRYLPNYWANWLGFVLFALVGITFLCWGVYYVADQQFANGLVALALTIALAYMVFLFGSTRLRD
jgi:hypothetical protein